MDEDLLIGRPAWIPWSGADASSVVVDRDHAVVRQQGRAQGSEIEPLVGRSFETTVVQVEPIYVDDDISHGQTFPQS